MQSSGFVTDHRWQDIRYRPTNHRSVNHHVRSSLFTCLTLLAACNDKADLPSDRLWQSDHFRVHARKYDPDVCKGITAVLERHFAVMQAYLRFPWKAGDKIDYYKFASREDYKANTECPDGAAA